ncbi:hypothetical protein HanPSC8_Chr12g0543381 [Helianthus annuus]|nr:hypothetical protein HanPSC8_Chr12g0543381 [Helianthus annuus]
MDFESSTVNADTTRKGNEDDTSRIATKDDRIDDHVSVNVDTTRKANEDDTSRIATEDDRIDDHASVNVDTTRKGNEDDMVDDHENVDEVEDDRIEDVDNMVVEILVNMDSFNYNVGKYLDAEKFVDEDYEVDFDLDDFESGSEDEGGNVQNLAIKQCKKKKERKSKCLEGNLSLLVKPFPTKRTSRIWSNYMLLELKDSYLSRGMKCTGLEWCVLG